MRRFAALAIAFAGCSVLIDGELPSVHCTEEGVRGAPACADDQICHEGVCVAATSPEPLGRPCVRDLDCGDGAFCLDPAALAEVGEKHCSRPCCTSRDCDPVSPATAPEFVCVDAKSTGGSFCRPALSAQRGPLGIGEVGSDCAVGGDCRSGLCRDKLCADTCCSDTNCAGTATRCQARSGGWSCEMPGTGSLVALTNCAKDSQCLSGLCAKVDAATICVDPCCSSKDCPASNTITLSCGYVPHGDGLVRACAVLGATTPLAPVGEPCMSPEECRGALCFGADKTQPGMGPTYCSDTCCNDESCGDQSKFACVLRQENGTQALRCELK
jgi:hypothetical protein